MRGTAKSIPPARIGQFSQTKRKMKVAIVTVTFNSEQVLEDFLRSLKAQTYSDYVLYVVDNASTDKTRSLLAGGMPAGSVVIENAHNAGFAGGTNQGIRRALADGCDAVLLLNNDVVLDGELLERLVTGLRAHQCQITAPKMYYHEPPNRIWAAGGELQSWLARGTHRGHDQLDSEQFGLPRRITFAPFCCVLIARNVFEEVGLLDEQYFAYVEDTDFMYRCLRADIAAWYIPEARLWHKVSSLTGFLSPFALHYGTRNRAYFISKNLPRPYQILLNIIYPAYLTVRYLARLDTREKHCIRVQAWTEGRRFLANRRQARDS